MNITGNTIFIPGSTSGIGQALAVALHEKGNTIIAGGRRRAELDRLAEQYPNIDSVVIDTADPASITGAAQTVLSRHPDLNVVVTMAGIMHIEDWTTSASGFQDSAEATITTNVLGPIRLIGAFIDHLRAQPDSTIITVTSGLAFAPLQVTPSYNASKAAIHMLSESLRLQLTDTSVRVIELVPPSVRTPLLPIQEDNPAAMPLDAFIKEVIELIHDQPNATEILVDTVKVFRFAAARGDYDEVVATLNAPDPHTAA